MHGIRRQQQRQWFEHPVPIDHNKEHLTNDFRLSKERTNFF